jgi:adenylate cyclase
MTACGTCATEVQDDARFCHQCGSPMTAQSAAEYKQVTVLFADVVRSMDIAAAVGSERLREIMAEVVDRSARVIRRFGGTVDKFTGDGIMAVFGAPTTLEDHAFRACLAAVDIQGEAAALAAQVKECDHITLQLRIGLNSGQVIAGDIGSETLGYTAIGDQVGMAQRMEAAAPPGGVMLSESTAQLVQTAVALGDCEAVQIKGTGVPAPARRLLAVGEHRPQPRTQPALVGRSWELNTITAILDEAIGGAGCVITIAGPPGIGKSRLVSEASAIAARRGVPVFTTYCESHTSDIPFRAVANLLRAVIGVDVSNTDAARAQIQHGFPHADPEDLLLLEDLLGVRDATAALPDVAAEARRRRLTTLINAASLARADPAVYVVEDAHWIDETSESMLVEFLSVVPQTPSLTLITYRPEYRGPLARVAEAQNLTLRPLSDLHSSTLTAELLGEDLSSTALGELVRSRAAGNPFFAEEIVRDLAERGVIVGRQGAYELRRDVVDANVPATLQATIGARIDRLDSKAKSTLNAAAVIGARFDEKLLSLLVDNPDPTALIEAELINQVAYGPRREFAFRHPLVRSVAYESQLRSDRMQRHRALAEAIKAGGSPDENAALIAEHMESAGELKAAYDWHMRAGAWLNYRDIAAARASWRRAQRVADRLPDTDPDRMSMRIATRTQLAGTAWRVGGGVGDPGFQELQELCLTAGDRQSLAIGLAGLTTQNLLFARRREASRLASQLIELIETLDDRGLTVALSTAAMAAKHESAEVAEAMRIAQRAIDAAGGAVSAGTIVFENPLAMALAVRGVTRFSMGEPGWKHDFNDALELTRSMVDPMTLATVTWWVYGNALCYGVRRVDAATLRDTAATLAVAEQSGDDYVLSTARMSRGLALLLHGEHEREAGLALLTAVGGKGRTTDFTLMAIPIVELQLARDSARSGEVDDAINLARTVADGLLDSGGCIWTGLATDVLVELLLTRGTADDLREVRAVIERLATVPTDPGFVLNEITVLRLRALLALASGTTAESTEMVARYRRRAHELDFEGHIAMSESLPTNQ